MDLRRRHTTLADPASAPSTAFRRAPDRDGEGARAEPIRSALVVTPISVPLALLLVLVLVLAPGSTPMSAWIDDYRHGPDSERQPGVPEGRVEGPFEWRSRIFADTMRQYWVYVPAQYAPETPAALMVFQDGHQYVATDREYRVPIVFDNLIHQQIMPVTIAVFVNPGHKGEALPENPWRASNRSVEYDTLDDTYARFLLEELLPEVGQSYTVTDDPEMRAIAGASSGGICAFTAAWQRPDAFRKVMSHIGSFTNIRGGHAYPALIRGEEPRPLRVFLQDGANDLDNRFGNWPLANQQMAAALRFKGYDYWFAYGDGGHTHRHGGAILPDTLRWLWR
jgi:enterochelin esterase-like enzyme